MAAEGERNPNSQSPHALAWHQVRHIAHTEAAGATPVHTLNSPLAETPVDVPATIPTTSGDAFLVLGFERVTVLVEVPAGARGGMTQLFLVPEIAYMKDANDGQFYPLFADEAETGALVGKVYEGPAAMAGALRIAFAFCFPTCGAYMRFKLYATNAGAGARATARVIRHQDSM